MRSSRIHNQELKAKDRGNFPAELLIKSAQIVFPCSKSSLTNYGIVYEDRQKSQEKNRGLKFKFNGLPVLSSEKVIILLPFLFGRHE